mgnify:CR=1 FL=1
MSIALDLEIVSSFMTRLSPTKSTSISYIAIYDLNTFKRWLIMLYEFLPYNDHFIFVYKPIILQIANQPFRQSIIDFCICIHELNPLSR